MAYKRKTRDEWRLWVLYDPATGWEHEVSEDSGKKIRAQLKDYRANCQYAVKITGPHRVRIEESL